MSLSGLEFGDVAPVRSSCAAAVRRLVLAGVLLVCAPPLEAQQPTPADSSSHVVRSGDTLWDLAEYYLNDPFRWPEIFSLNRNVVQDPHWIHPRDRLLIPGRSRMGDPSSGSTVSRFPGLESRTVFYQTEKPPADPLTVRMTPQEEVAAVESGAYYRAPLLLRETEIGRLGELVEVVSPTVVPRRGSPQIHPFDRVLMRVDGSVSEGDRLHLLRVGKLVEPHGRMYLPTGQARVLSVTAGTAVVEIDRMYDRVEVGDVAVSLPVFGPRPGVRPRESGGLAGHLLSVTTGEPVVGTGDIGFVDLGASSGVVEGDEFIAYLPAEAVNHGIRPEMEIARLQVVRAGPSASAIRVISLEQPALRAGMPVRLVARMPADN